MFKVVVMEADLEILEKVEKGLDQKTLMFFLLFLKKKIVWLWLTGNKTFNRNGL